MLSIYQKVFQTGRYNFEVARCPIPSGLNINAWKHYLQDYKDKDIVNYLEFGWPSGFHHGSSLISTFENHKSGVEFGEHIDTYLSTEISHSAILGPFASPPVVPLHLSPIMTRHKKDSLNRRIVVDLSWPKGYSINDGIKPNFYLGQEINLKLPTVDYMADRVRFLGQGCYMYKLDVSRGYRQMRLDPLDWPLMAIKHKNQLYMDMCPPFGLRTAAMMMQCTNMAVSYIHSLHGFLSRPFIDDFGGAELHHNVSSDALTTLQNVIYNVGLVEAPGKTFQPSTRMPWLGIDIDSVEMTLSIPQQKLQEVKSVVKQWEGREMANRKQVQSLMGSLNFVGSVAPPVRILNFLREMPSNQSVLITKEVKEDIVFFNRLMPRFNGVTLLDKSLDPAVDLLEVDACLTGCGGLSGSQFYSAEFPSFILEANHPIAHLELLNIVVALRMWISKWGGQKLQIYCDNMNSCMALQTGRSRDPFMQSSIRTIFLLSVLHDVEILVSHRPGISLVSADALSRLHKAERYRSILEELGVLEGKLEVVVPAEHFVIHD